MRHELSETSEEIGELGMELPALRGVRAPAGLLPAVMTRVGLADRYFPIETPIGEVFVAYNERGVSAVVPADDTAEFEQAFQASCGRAAYLATEPPASLRRAVVEGLQGRSGHVLRFDLRERSEFERAVLHKALEIPRGEVRPYAWVAREIGRPKAVRAVGSALAHNPIPLLIPCHRVVRSDGVIGQYGLGGPANKRAILEAEGANLTEIEQRARQGVRYIGSETTKIYCFPSCRNARRITPRHEHAFRSETEAAAAGFRPCKVCRPAAIAMGA
ncbi:MAG: methylated-DNA--[protein]-cysteine S-methyltransferase [Chloroflexota bacterium]|nr:methylated-DNA--[protein]-cysteine S-methyltransferase [Chloroflexota bacterium]